MGRVGVPLTCDAPRENSTQVALQHKLDNRWFDEGLRERLGHSNKRINQLRHGGVLRKVGSTHLRGVHTQNDESVRQMRVSTKSSMDQPDNGTRRSMDWLGKPHERAHMRSQPNLAKGHDLVNR
jgi:hypothetical protein